MAGAPPGLRPSSTHDSRTAPLARHGTARDGATLTRRRRPPPSTPDSFRDTLYRGAGGELFRNRSGDDRGVRGYEITRDGQSLGIRDATSRHDPSLRPDTSHVSTIVAIVTAGQRSSVARTTLGGGTTPPPAGARPPRR